MEVTVQPVRWTARMAKEPQPVPISRTWSVGLRWALSMKRLSFVYCACSRVSVKEAGSDRGSQIGQEYVISGERKAANMALLMS